jgi:hypothetical protein
MKEVEIAYEIGGQVGLLKAIGQEIALSHGLGDCMIVKVDGKATYVVPLGRVVTVKRINNTVDAP